MAARGRPALSEQEVEDRRAVILQAVLEEISERGAGAVRMKDVARAAHVSVGSIQYYFDSREQLVLAAFRKHSENVIDRVRSSSRHGMPPWDSLVQTFHDFLRVENFSMRTRLWVEFVAASTRDEQLRELLDDVFLTWKQVIRDIVDAGVADKTFTPLVEPEVAIDALLAQLDGFEIAHATGSRDTDVPRIEHVLQQSARALLGAKAAVESVPEPTGSAQKE